MYFIGFSLLGGSKNPEYHISLFLCLKLSHFVIESAYDNKKALRTHDLKKLINAISQDHVVKIKELYSMSINEPNLDDLVLMANDYFVKVRYDYEYNVFIYGELPLYVLAESLYCYLSELYKSEMPNK